jgi:glycosyltransferase involved in cell wall biosynthesis
MLAVLEAKYNFKSKIMNKPLISVIIPAYNEANYIVNCLDSLANQIHSPEHEIIVCDNGSTDGTVELVKNHKLKPRLVIESTRGVANARQAGLEVAQGEIIVSTDADCLFKTNWLEKIEIQFKDKTVVGVAGNYHFMNAPLWARVLPYLGSVLVWLIYIVTKKTIYASAANLSFRKKYTNGYSLLETQGSDERGIIKQLVKNGRVKVILKNPVYTSARRVRKGIFHGIFVTIGYYYTFNVWQTKKQGYSSIGHQPVIRTEDDDSVWGLVERYLFFLILVIFLTILFK